MSVSLRLFFLLIVLTSGANARALDVTTVFLVRHAEKAAMPKNDPVLSDIGKIRAQQLARILGNTVPDAIFASDYQRTQLTVTPLAQAVAHQVLVREAGKSRALAHEILNRYRGGTVVVAGHSNTVPEIIVALGGEAPVIGEDDYDNLFVLIITKDDKVKTLSLHFGEGDQ